MIELLAPAKSLAAGRAAIHAGADAVYIGAPRFGARDAASNSIEDIASLAVEAHKYWARVYVTLNTLLRDDELPQAVRMTHALHEAGIDGLIIQDFGLLKCDLPPLPLIASTQMHNHTAERVAFLEKIGFQRAILARELSLEDIRAIRKLARRIELEFFVHGALCVCYSGQCYLSQAIGGRSGNRGQCAQPCRKSYRLLDHHERLIGDPGHWLSIRDLNLSAHLGELLDAGITSFKIEGRLKDQPYVTNIVSYYRQQLDQHLAKRNLSRSSSGQSTIDFTPDPNKTFNRGYTTHFLFGRRCIIGAHATPKMVGEKVGRVVKINTSGTSIDSDVDLHPGDGICYFNREGNLTGTTVNRVNGRQLFLEDVKQLHPGATLYRNHDHDFLTHLKQAKITRKIAVLLSVSEEKGQLKIVAIDEDGVKAERLFSFERVPAQDQEKAVAMIRRQLAKSGDTEFIITDINANLPAFFFPVSTLNEFRRQILDALRVKREAARPKPDLKRVELAAVYPEKNLGFQGNVLNEKAAEFYREHGVHTIQPAAETGISLLHKRVMTTRYCLRHELGICPRQDKQAGNDPLLLVDEEGDTLELRFNCRNCRMEVYLMRRK